MIWFIITGLVPGAGYSVARTNQGAADTVVITVGGPLPADAGGVLEIVNTVPQIQTILVVRGAIRLRLRIPARAGQSVTVEASNDLSTWRSVGSPQSGANGIDFDDTASDASATRFYRAVGR